MAVARSAVILVDGVHSGTLDLKEKEFSTGSRGFYAYGKITIGGKQYQVGGNFVEIGSKPGSKPKQH